MRAYPTLTDVIPPFNENGSGAVFLLRDTVVKCLGNGSADEIAEALGNADDGVDHPPR